MPVRPRYLERRNRACLELSGDIPPADDLSSLGTGSAPPRLRSDTMVLIDLAGTRRVVAGVAETVAAVAMHAPLDLGFRATRMFDQTANARPRDIAVRRTEAAVLAHLRQPGTSLRTALFTAV